MDPNTRTKSGVNESDVGQTDVGSDMAKTQIVNQHEAARRHDAFLNESTNLGVGSVRGYDIEQRQQPSESTAAQRVGGDAGPPITGSGGMRDIGGSQSQSKEQGGQRSQGSGEQQYPLKSEQQGSQSGGGEDTKTSSEAGGHEDQRELGLQSSEIAKSINEPGEDYDDRGQRPRAERPDFDAGHERNAKDNVEPVMFLVLYSTHSGHSHKVAEHICERVCTDLDRDHICVHVVDVASEVHPPPRAADYDVVLVGSPVYMGKHDRSIVSWVKDNRDDLLERPSAFFSVSDAAASDDESKRDDGLKHYLAKFIEETHWRPLNVAFVGGAHKWTQYGFLTKLAMKQVSKAEHFSDYKDTSHDYEFTEWDHLNDWVKGFVDNLPDRIKDRCQRFGSMNSALPDRLDPSIAA